MTNEEARKLVLGIYRISWKSGGISVAAVGRDPYGKVWYAPTNWVRGIPCFDWGEVKEVQLITTQKQEKDRKDIEEETLEKLRKEMEEFDPPLERSLTKSKMVFDNYEDALLHFHNAYNEAILQAERIKAAAAVVSAGRNVAGHTLYEAAILLLTNEFNHGTVISQKDKIDQMR